MQPITTVGFVRPSSLCPGHCPELSWIAIADLVVACRGERELDDRSRLTIKRIADTFSWCCFAPAVVTPTESGKFVIIDGFRRVTAAAVIGFDAVPCQIVKADTDQLAVAGKVLNGGSRPNSRMASHAAKLIYNEPTALRLSQICERADVQLLRYPVPIDRQAAGQTMAIAGISQCLAQYGEETLITALHCVTQTTNNQPGLLSGRMIKALCAVLDGDHDLRDRGLALLEAFDSIDLATIQSEALKAAEKNKVRPVQLMIEQIRSELARLLFKPATIAPSLPVPRSKIFRGGQRALGSSAHVPNRPKSGRSRPEMID
jgi:hypothetical protein